MIGRRKQSKSAECESDGLSFHHSTIRYRVIRVRADRGKENSSCTASPVSRVLMSVQ